MAKTTTPPTPVLRHHKPSGRAVVRIEGRDFYLGEYGTPEAEANYHAKIQEWIANRYRLPVAVDDITLNEVSAAYLEHCRSYYHDHRTGKPSSTYTEINLSVRAALKLYGHRPAIDFTPNSLRAVRHTWVGRGLAITTINSYSGNVKLMFKWAAAHELIPETTYNALALVENLKRGRGVGKNPEQRQPVPLEHVEATIPHLPRQLQAVVQLMRYTGARPSEILNLKRGDIDADPKAPVWVAAIRDHKTMHHGKQRFIPFGPRAQAVLKPFLLRPDDSYLFSPAEAERERYQRQAQDTVGRRKNQKPNPRKTERTVGDHYNYRNLGVAIQRVCDAEGIPRWTPYQIRHLFATTAEATSDWETARILLGHSSLDMTRTYVHKDLATAVAYASQHG